MKLRSWIDPAIDFRLDGSEPGHCFSNCWKRLVAGYAAGLDGWPVYCEGWFVNLLWGSSVRHGWLLSESDTLIETTFTEQQTSGGVIYCGFVIGRSKHVQRLRAKNQTLFTNGTLDEETFRQPGAFFFDALYPPESARCRRGCERIRREPIARAIHWR